MLYPTQTAVLGENSSEAFRGWKAWEVSAGWQAQSAGYAGIAEAAGCAVERVTVPGANHFSMLFDAVNAGGRSFEAFAAKM